MSRPIWMEKENPLLFAGRVVVLVIACALVVVPFWSIIATSFADPTTIARSGGGLVLWPEGATLAAYRSILTNPVVTQALAVSIGITLVGTLLSLATSVGIAYWLSRPQAIGRRAGMLLILGAVLFSPGFIPVLLVVRELGLMDTFAALILPGMVSAFNVIVLRSFFMDLPQELFDSAAIDGAGPIRTLFGIVLPLSKAVLAVIGLFYAVEYWGAFFNALLYIQSSEKNPLSLVLRTFVVNQAPFNPGTERPGQVLPPQLSMQMAVLVVSMVPIMCVYPFLQKHFAKGMMIGAVKG